MKRSDKTYAAVYHLGHYGFFLKFIVHKLTYFRNESALLLIDSGTMSNETYCFILRRINELSSLFDVDIYNDMTFFCNEADEQSLKDKIITYFDGVQRRFGRDITPRTKVYSGFDGRSSFGAYMTLTHRPYILCDLATFSLKPNRSIFVKTPGESIYVKLMNQTMAMYYKNPYVQSVIWVNSNESEILNKPSEFVDFVHLLEVLGKKDIEWLLNLFEISIASYENKRCALLICNSTGIMVWGKITKRDYFNLYHGIINHAKPADLILAVKCHPNFEFNEIECSREFPHDLLIPGYVPFELLRHIPSFSIERLISTGSTASNMPGVESFNYTLNSFKYSRHVERLFFIQYLACEKGFRITCDNDILMELYQTIDHLHRHYRREVSQEVVLLNDGDAVLESEDFICLGIPKVKSIDCVNVSEFVLLRFSHSKTFSLSDGFVTLRLHDVDPIALLSEYCKRYGYEKLITVVPMELAHPIVDANAYIEKYYSKFKIDFTKKKFDSASKALRQANVWGDYDFELADCLLRIGTSDDYDCAVSILMNHAIGGESEGIVKLALALSSNPENQTLSKQLLEKAVRINPGYSGRYVSYLLSCNRDDFSKIAFDYCFANKRKHALELARMYRDGKGTTQNLEFAKNFFKESIQYSLVGVGEYADILIRIGGTDQYEEAFKICMSVADKDAGAMIRIARMYRKGQHVSIDLDRSILYYQMGVNRGAKWALSEYYDALWAVKDLKIDAKLFSELRKNLNSGDPRVVGRLAKCYRYGRGTERNIPKAISLLKTVAGKSAYWNLELVNCLIELNTKESKEEAFETIQRFASRDLKSAALLSEMYEKGIGTEINHVQSIAWLNISEKIN